MFVDGHFLGERGVDITRYSAERFMNVVDNFYIMDNMHEEGYLEARNKSRAKLQAMYNGDGLSGVANDDPEWLPYQETPQTEAGFEGLEPPMG